MRRPKVKNGVVTLRVALVGTKGVGKTAWATLISDGVFRPGESSSHRAHNISLRTNKGFAVRFVVLDYERGRLDTGPIHGGVVMFATVPLRLYSAEWAVENARDLWSSRGAIPIAFARARADEPGPEPSIGGVVAHPVSAKTGEGVLAPLLALARDIMWYPDLEFVEYPLSAPRAPILNVGPRQYTMEAAVRQANREKDPDTLVITLVGASGTGKTAWLDSLSKSKLVKGLGAIQVYQKEGAQPRRAKCLTFRTNTGRALRFEIWDADRDTTAPNHVTYRDECPDGGVVMFSPDLATYREAEHLAAALWRHRGNIPVAFVESRADEPHESRPKPVQVHAISSTTGQNIADPLLALAREILRNTRLEFVL